MWKAVVLGAAAIVAFAMPLQAASHSPGATTFDIDDSSQQTPASQAPEHNHDLHEPASPPAPSSGPAGSKPGMMSGMMAKRQQMISELVAADVRIDALVKEMRQATGQAKIDLMAQVIDELARQSRSMREHMGTGSGMMCGDGAMPHK